MTKDVLRVAGYGCRFALLFKNKKVEVSFSIKLVAF